METLQINTGVKRIAINGDPERVISFNPSDVQFAERFYELVRDFETKQSEYERRAAELDEGAKKLDEHGIPVNISEGIAFLRETCEYLYGKIDYLFGPGTSQKVFEGALSLDAVSQFFEGITPFFQAIREERMTRYLNAKNAGRVMK